MTLVLGSDGREHPLVGVWRRRTAARIDDALKRGQFEVRSLLRAWRVGRLQPEALGPIDASEALTNLNAPEDVAELE